MAETIWRDAAWAEGCDESKGRPTLTLSERHARIGRALEVGGHSYCTCAVQEHYAALLAFARSEWKRAGRLLSDADQERDYPHASLEYIDKRDGEAAEILTRLESALAQLLGEGGTK